jgi:hypothetical protein
VLGQEIGYLHPETVDRAGSYAMRIPGIMVA